MPQLPPPLAPCPFCGGAARIDSNHQTGGSEPAISVTITHVCCEPPRGLVCITAPSQAEAVAGWNRRAG